MEREGRIGSALRGANALIAGLCALSLMLLLLTGVAIRAFTRPPLEALAPQRAPAVAAAVSAPPRSEPAALRPMRPRPLSGQARVVDTGAIEIRGRVVRLRGVRGMPGPPAEQFARWLAGRPVECWPAGGGRYVCEAGGFDLAEVVLFNGGGRATADAPLALRRAEREAQAERRGVWAREPARLAPGAPRR